MFCPSELAGGTPHTVRCNAKKKSPSFNVLSIRTGGWLTSYRSSKRNLGSGMLGMLGNFPGIPSLWYFHFSPPASPHVELRANSSSEAETFSKTKVTKINLELSFEQVQQTRRGGGGGEYCQNSLIDSRQWVRSWVHHHTSWVNWSLGILIPLLVGPHQRTQLNSGLPLRDKLMAILKLIWRQIKSTTINSKRSLRIHD